MAMKKANSDCRGRRDVRQSTIAGRSEMTPERILSCSLRLIDYVTRCNFPLKLSGPTAWSLEIDLK